MESNRNGARGETPDTLMTFYRFTAGAISPHRAFAHQCLWSACSVARTFSTPLGERPLAKARSPRPHFMSSCGSPSRGRAARKADAPPPSPEGEPKEAEAWEGSCG